MFDVCFLYSLGFIGLLFLKRKLKLSPIAFTILFLLFNFNGNILAHYNVGHASFGGYFLFPWFIWLVLRLLDGDHSWLWTSLMAVLLFAIWLQGSYHQYTWLLILLALIGILVPRTFFTIVRTGIATLLVSAFRVLPCILSYPGYSNAFLNGYPSLFSIWDNLVNLQGAQHPSFFVDPGLGTGVGTWELACFIGLLGGIFLVYFGIYRGLLHVKASYNTLLVPIGIMVLLTLGPVFGALRHLPIPLIQGERVSSRIISVPLVFALVLGAEQFQRWIDGISKKMLVLGGCVVGLLISGVELWQDFLIWRISNRDQNFWIYFNPAKWYPKNNMGDTIYIWLIFGGLALSILTIAALSYISWREFRKKKLAELSL